MTIDLAEYESGQKYRGDYDADLARLQKRLAHIQVAHIVHNKRAHGHALGAVGRDRR